MTNLFEKLNKEAGHIKLTAGEKSAMRAALFGAPSPAVVVRSPYVFLSHTWIRAFAAVVLVVFVGGSTAFAAQSALPGEPLYAVKTNILEPAQLALAGNAAAKASVHVEIAQARVAEAEALAQKGTLTATTSAALAANFEEHAQSASALADEVSADDPAAAVQIKAQLNANAAVGGAVLAALGRERGDGNQEHANAIAVRVLARADGGRPAGAQAAPKAATVRAMAVSTFSAGGDSGESAGGSEASIEQQNTAARLELKAQFALTAARALASASSTLDATTSADVQTSLAGIDALIQSGSQALSDSQFETAISDFTQALSKALKLSALLKAQQTFDNHTLDSLFKSGDHGDSGGDSGGSGQSGEGSGDISHPVDLHL